MSIRLHYTWIFIFAVITAIVTTQFSESYPLWQRLTLSLVVSLLFLAAVIIRELILSTAPLRRETPIKQITIFAFGGIYQENKDRIVTTHLGLLYLARYLSNLVIAAIFYGLYATFINTDNLMLAGVAQWLTYLFFLFFLMHFVPAFPLDGGQILRMLLWRSTGDYYKATHIASLVGWVVGLFMMFAGVLVFIVTRQWGVSLEIILIGWVIQAAAGYTRRKIRLLTVLQGIQTQDVMTRQYPVLSGQVKVRQLIREHLLKKGWNYIIVADGNQLKGVLTLPRIKSVSWKLWDNTTVGDIMVPSREVGTAHPQQTADTLFEEMDQRGLDFVPVLEGDNLIGVVTRDALLGVVKVRSGFGV